MSEIDLDIMEKLVAMMIDNDLAELLYRQGDLEINLKRGTMMPAGTQPVLTTNPMGAPPAPPSSPPPEILPAVVDEHAGLVPITSPMVGTYYASPDPESPPFVSVGAVIDENTTVCIIEAMKVFNEIKAEVEGTIEKIVANSAQAVEYGEILFYVRPR